jgi:flagellar biosynthetic protein FliR
MTLDHVITQVGTQQVAAFFLVLARVSPLFILAPLFSSRMLPARVRGIVAVALSIGLSPVVARQGQIPTDMWSLAGLLGKELVVGVAFAYVLSALLAALQVAGSFLDTLVGFSFGSTIDPVTGVQSTMLSQLYTMVGTLVFIAIGGDGWVVRGLGRTYDIVSATQYPSVNRLVEGALTAFTGIFTAAVEVAGPVMLALIVTDAAFGVVSRVVPQLNVFAVGFPAKIVVGLVLVGATLPFVANWLGNELQTDVGLALHTLKVG